MIVTVISISNIYLVVSGHHRTNLSISTQICVTCESGYYTTLTTTLHISSMGGYSFFNPMGRIYTVDLIVGAG